MDNLLILIKMNIDKNEDIYYVIYFNDDKTKIKRTFINKEDNVSKINIIIGINVIFFDKLFENCECIESINLCLLFVEWSLYLNIDM